ncbi:zinc finger, CCHC-type containing protein [Tanacetum coccineum]
MIMISKMRDKINPKKKRLNLEEAKGQKVEKSFGPDFVSFMVGNEPTSYQKRKECGPLRRELWGAQFLRELFSEPASLNDHNEHDYEDPDNVEPVYVQNRVSVNEISSLKEGKLEWRKMVKCKYVRSGCTTALNVVPWETDGESVLREACPTRASFHDLLLFSYLSFIVSVFCFYPIRSNMIISFDLKSDEFGEVCLPGRFLRMNKFTILKVYESLGWFEYHKEGETRFCDVWIMKEGVTKSFTKMLSIKAPDSWVSYRVLELRKNGEVIIENIDIHTRLYLKFMNPLQDGLVVLGLMELQ